jgi:hypothetical protein
MQHIGSDWEDVSAITTTATAFRVDGVEQRSDYINPTSFKRFNQSPDVNPYSKVLCTFNDGEKEVHPSLCFPNHDL